MTMLVHHRKGILALLSSSISNRSTCAFSSSINKNRSIIRRQSSRVSHIIAKSTTKDDDPSLSNDYDYEWLKASRPMRICARPLPLDYGDGNDDIGSSVTGTKKIVHFQRHGQGTHNELYKKVQDETGIPPDLSSLDPLKNPLLLEHITDSPLTQKGINQCIEQRPVAKQLNGIELVIVSPLVRALQTAHITFEDHLPSYNNNASSEEEKEKSKSVKWIAHEGIREEFGTLLCNKRRPLSETMAAFPKVDYSYMASMEDEDVAWRQYTEMNANEEGIVKREELVDISHRAYNFMVDFVLEREEKEIAVVGHSHYYHALTNCVLDVGDNTNMTSMFGQAEIRSFELEFLLSDGSEQ